MMTTVVIAITVDAAADGTFHPSTVSSFLKKWEEHGLPTKIAQDIRFHTLSDKRIANLMNKIALGEIDEQDE